MKTRQIAFLAVAGLLGMGALGVAACSSSSSSSGALPGGDSSTGDGSGSSSSGSSGTSGGSSGTSGGSSGTSGSSGASSGGTDAGADCGKLPVLFAEDGGTGVFCHVGDAGAVKDHCALQQTCCRPGGSALPPETCAASDVACGFTPDGGTTWGCDTKLECPAGEGCYMLGTVNSVSPDCPNLKGKGVKYTKCHATPAAAGEEEICAQDSDCTAPKICKPFSTNGRNIGFCN